ncbi:MAG: inorganic diphosphatase [Acidimicrobiales bacterium]|nr:inorganic diphosphatase [Acidimicrobiales bacterium]
MTEHKPFENCVDAVIEIPRGSRNKYEMDHESGIIRLDRRLFSATVYPADYGFVPDTLAEDGDPLDILVLLEDPTFPGCWVTARPVGMLAMEDEKGRDVKIIAVEPNEPRFREVFDLGDVQPQLLEEIRHFFEVYKMLEPGKHAATGDFYGREAAWAEIQACRSRHGARIDTLP